MKKILNNILNNIKLICAIIILLGLIFMAFYPVLTGQKKTKTYNVKINLKNANTPITELTVKKKNNAVFNYVLDEGYDTEIEKSNCKRISISDGKITIKKVKKNLKCNITFKKKTYTAKINVENGSVDKNKKTVKYGKNVTFDIKANKNYSIENPIIECNNSSDTSVVFENGKITINNVKDNVTCNIVLNKNNGENPDPNPEVNPNPDPNPEVNPNPDPNPEVNPNPNPEPDPTPSTPTTPATPKPQQTTYSVNLTVKNGKTDKSKVTVKKGNNAEFNITPNEGYTTSEASIVCSNNNVKLSGTKLTVNNINSNTNCTVEFKKQKLKVVLYLSGISNETVSASVNYEEDVTIYIQNKTLGSSTILTMDKSSIKCSPSMTVETPTWNASNSWLAITFKNVKHSATCSAVLGKK